MDAPSTQGRGRDTDFRGRSAAGGNGQWPRGRGRGRSVSASEIRKVREQYRNAKTVRQLGRLKKSLGVGPTSQLQSQLVHSDGGIKGDDREAPTATATEGVGQEGEEGGESRSGTKEKKRRREVMSEESLRLSKKESEAQLKERQLKARKRKGEVEKLRKVTRKGQPIMRHRVDLLLEKLEKSTS